jgi:hypothetical protein
MTARYIAAGPSAAAIRPGTTTVEDFDLDKIYISADHELAMLEAGGSHVASFDAESLRYFLSALEPYLQWLEHRELSARAEE